jgi:hypothetical protein
MLTSMPRDATSSRAEQIVAYFVSALAAGAMFRLWRRYNEQDRQRVWRFYGWYSGLMFCGSCVGVMTWGARIFNLVNLYKGINDLRFDTEYAGFGNLSSSTNVAEGLRFVAVGRSWRAVYSISYPIEFFFLSVAKLMVLDRMSDFFAPHGSDMRRWSVLGARIVTCVVVFCNAVGLSANIAAAIHFQKSSEAFFAAAASVAANNIIDGLLYVTAGQAELQRALSIASVKNFFEAVTLLLIVAVFSAVGLVSARRISSALTVLESSGTDMAAGMRLRRSIVDRAKALGKQLRQEVVVTTGFVFVAFLLRSVVSTILAFAGQFQDTANFCSTVVASSSCDAACFNEFTHLVNWNNNTPEFLSTVVLISSPLTLLIALWGMTAKLTLRPGKLEAVPLALHPLQSSANLQA